MNAVFRIFAIILPHLAVSLAWAESHLPTPQGFDEWPTTKIATDDWTDPVRKAENLTDLSNAASRAPAAVKTLKLTVWQNAPAGSDAGSGVIPYPNVKGVLFLNGQPAGTVTTNADGVAYLQNIEEGLAEFVAESEADNRFGSEECPVNYSDGTLATLDFLLTDHGLVRFDGKNPAESDLTQNGENFDEFQADSVSAPMEYYPESHYDFGHGSQRYGRSFPRGRWGLLGLAGLAGLAGIEPVSPSSPSQ